MWCHILVIIISVIVFTGILVNQQVMSCEAIRPVAEMGLVFSRSSSVELIQYWSGTYFFSLSLRLLAILKDGVPI